MASVQGRLAPASPGGVDVQSSFGDVTESYQLTPRHTEVCGESVGRQKEAGSLMKCWETQFSSLKKNNYIRFLDQHLKRA